MEKQRLDTYDNFPTGMRNYLSKYGWHFSKKMCEWAVSKMKTKDASTGKAKNMEPMTKESVDEILKKYGVKLENDNAYDAVYTMCMAKSDYFKSSIPDEQHLALFVKDYIDDIDAYNGMPFTRFYSDCIGHGIVIMWEELI